MRVEGEEIGRSRWKRAEVDRRGDDEDEEAVTRKKLMGGESTNVGVQCPAVCPGWR